MERVMSFRILFVLLLAAVPASAQDGILNPEEGGLAALTGNLATRPEWLGVTCWQIYEAQKGGMHNAAMDAMQACAAAGNEPSMILLSHAYENGLGVPKSAELATYWVKQAALRGYVTAQYHYARALLEGSGIPQDAGQARFWLMQAAAGGDSDAQAMIAAWPAS